MSIIIIKRNIIIGCLTFVVASQNVYGQVRYDVTPINLGPFNSFVPRSINDSGLVVGDGYVGTDHFAALYVDSVLVILNLPGTQSWAWDINDSGYVVGKYQQTPGSPEEGFVFRDGNFITLPTLGGNKNHAYAINNKGAVVGMSATSGQFNPDHAYLFSNGIMTDLGTLVGDEYVSWANSVNDSGEIVGVSSSALYPNSGHHAFLFRNGAMIDLGTLGGFYSEAWAINNKGQIAGQSDLVSGVTGFLYENGNMISLGSFYPAQSSQCINDSGLIVGRTNFPTHMATLYDHGTFINLNQLIDSSSGWILERARSINNKGIIVGEGTYNGQRKPFLLIPKKLTVIQPKVNDKWIAGEKDTIKWNGGKKNQFLQIDYSADSGHTFNNIDFVTNADTGIYVWDIPINILSKKCMIRVLDMVDTTIADTSDVFKIKPYILTRDSSGQYEPYRTEEDQWGFWNNPDDIFPQTWFQQFDYHGIDPFTNSSYSLWQGGYVFLWANSSDFPDWVSWVNTFGVNACYLSTTSGIYSPLVVLRWAAIKNNWIGSCFGIAASNALAFSYKGQFQTKFSSFQAFANPITVFTNNGVKKAVNELFTHQFGDPSKQSHIGRWNVVAPNQTISELKEMFKVDNVSPRTLSIWNNNGPGGHNILPYKLQQDFTTKNIYYLFVYDNSYPTSFAVIKIDTLGNSNNGTWTPLYGWPNWGGPKYLMLENESSVYFNNATFKRTESYTSPFVLSSDKLEVYTNIDANTKIIDALGNVTGYSNGSVLSDIPNSTPSFYLDGSETPPYGYSLPTDNYSVIVDNFASDTVKTFFFTGNKTFSYRRDSADQNQTDRLFFDGGISVTNPDQQNKTINLLNIINETTQEKLFAISSIELEQNDSVKIENPDGNKIKLTSIGTAKDYDIEINYVNENGIGRFGDFNIPLPANSSHTIIPEWTDVANTLLKIIVDEGNNGTVDDTLSLINQLTGLGNDQGSVLPTEFRLEQNYPNPFNPITKIRYAIPALGTSLMKFVQLKVYDVLGNEVATLVDEYRPAGRHEVEFDAKNLASGIYFYRIKAGSFVETKKMILLR